MALYDLGQGIIVNHKTINASQIVGDLITRQQNVTMAEIGDIINAGGETDIEVEFDVTIQ